MSVIAIITARGGSKRIPKKNIKEFCGRPIIAYSIEAALMSGVFDEVMVSTDSEEIADVSQKYGAVVPFMRSEANSNDYATTNDTLMEVFSEYEKKGNSIEYACCIYPTAPFITGDKLKAAMDLLVKKKADCVMSVVPFSYPPQRGLITSDSGTMSLIMPEYIDSRSQDLQKMYHDAGQFYAINVTSFKKNKKLMIGKLLPYVLSELEVQDIDTETDWKLAEMKYNLLR